MSIKLDMSVITPIINIMKENITDIISDVDISGNNLESRENIINSIKNYLDGDGISKKYYKYDVVYNKEGSTDDKISMWVLIKFIPGQMDWVRLSLSIYKKEKNDGLNQ